MPKVIIREIDNSTSGLAQSNNFTVVVPAFPGQSAAGYNLDDLLDENGCYEFTSQADFVNYVGLRGAIGKDKKIEPTSVAISEALVAYGDPTGKETSVYKKYVVTPKFANLLSPSKEKVEVEADTEVETTTGDTTTVRTTSIQEVTLDYGVSQLKLDTGNGIYYLAVEDKSLNKTVKHYVYVVEEVSGKISGNGYADFSITDKSYKLVPVTDLTQIFAVYDDTAIGDILYEYLDDVYVTFAKQITGTYLDATGNTHAVWGDDGVAFRHKGNQIAYELLGLGYPVLFKKLHGNFKYVDNNGNEIKKSDGSSWTEIELASFWECLKDRSMYNFRFITTGGDYRANVNEQIAAVAECATTTDTGSVSLEDADTFGNVKGRGDCTALCDIDEEATDASGNLILNTDSLEKTIKSVGTLAGQIGPANKYTAIFAPRVIYSMSNAQAAMFEGGDSARTFPASFNYLACLANSMSKYAEWYAAAGYTRGISPKLITKTTIKFGEIANNTLSPRVINQYTNRAINLVLCDHGSYYLGGNRTAYTLDRKGLVFSHFLNIRQLCTTIKKQVYATCKQLTFDPNSDLLWLNFVNAIKPTLEAMKADQGINGYKISQVKTAKKGVVIAKIRIVPIEAVEDFDISLSLEDSLSGIVVGADETVAE